MQHHQGCSQEATLEAIQNLFCLSVTCHFWLLRRQGRTALALESAGCVLSHPKVPGFLTEEQATQEDKRGGRDQRVPEAAWLFQSE